MLIRPVFFKLLAIVLGNEADMSSIDSLLDLSSQCLEAAKCNIRILTMLASLQLLAKYGFYDSLHLFSSIKILLLSRLVNAIRPQSLAQKSGDLALYCAGRDLLLSMAARGNLASRGHMRMLEEIERHLPPVAQQEQGGRLGLNEGPQGQDVQMHSCEWDDIEPWIDSVGGGLDSFLDMAGFPGMGLDDV